MKTTLQKIYPDSLIWVDWGILSKLTTLASLKTQKYDFDKAKLNIYLLLDVLKNKYSITNPKLILGMQLLEAETIQRKEFLKKLCEEFQFPISKIPEIEGFQEPHTLYAIFELLGMFIHYLIDIPISQISQQFCLKSRQKSLDVFYDCLPKIPVTTIEQFKAKTLGDGYRDIFDTHRQLCAQKDIKFVYKMENAAYLRNLKDILLKAKKIFTSTLSLINRFPTITWDAKIQYFFESPYFTILLIPKIWANMYAFWLKRYKSNIESSDRSDLLNLIEIATLADIGFVDKRTFHAWEHRPISAVKIPIKKSGELSSYLSI